ncbi:MAG: hypothetical protein R8K46_05135 [Mariprofundaceae bacterium]
MKVVVDTNVPMAANGRKTHANEACQYACIEFLEQIVSAKSRTKIVLDKPGLIFDEYKHGLNFSGQPGVGDIFFKYLHDHMFLGKKVQLVPIEPINDDTRGFDELPANKLDPSDRKFLAVAITSSAKIVNALDPGWHEQQAFISGLGLTVQQLCPEHGCAE